MNGFDSIINALDQHLEPKRYVSPNAPVPIEGTEDVTPRPVFTTGDTIIIRETRWPPNTGVKVNYRTGLYSEPGFPVLEDLDLPKAEHEPESNPRLQQRLRAKLIGAASIGDRCKVIALWCHDDGKTYYFLDNGKRDGRGWTRCSYRFTLANEDTKRQR